jgi:hypothetical protein
LHQIEEIIMDPIENETPTWTVNRKKDQIIYKKDKEKIMCSYFFLRGSIFLIMMDSAWILQFFRMILNPPAPPTPGTVNA